MKQFALGFIAACLVAVVASRFATVRFTDGAPVSNHSYETAFLVPEWCEESAARAIVQSLGSGLQPLDLRDHWDVGSRAVVVIGGDVQERDSLTNRILAECQIAKMHFSGEQAFALLTKELEQVLARPSSDAIILRRTSSGLELMNAPPR